MPPNMETLNVESNSHHLVVQLKSDEHQHDGVLSLALTNYDDNLMKPKLKFENDNNEDDSTVEPLSDMSSRSGSSSTNSSSSGSVSSMEQQSKKDQTRKIWHAMLKQGQIGVTTGAAFIDDNDDDINSNNSIIQALSTIRILNDPSSSPSSERDTNEQWLCRHDGKLDDLPIDLIQELRHYAPKEFHARVADFNDNLFYQMSEQYGLNHHLKERRSENIRNNNAIVNPDEILHSILQSTQFLGSYLATETTTPQPPHVDFTWERLEEFGNDLRLGFFPLTMEGMFLQIWSRDDNLEHKDIKGELIYIPYGKLLTLPASVIHGGGFRTTPILNMSHCHDYGSDNITDTDHGNLRFHLYIASNKAQLSKNQTTNKYTEPGDKRKELADRYTDAPMMDVLMKHLFVN